MQIRSRVKELRHIPANELLPNPKNWRTHPKQQLDAIRGALAEIGFAGAELARETPEGVMLIDGHARAEVSGTNPIPVLILDVSESEADKILMTFDPLGAMAEANKEKLEALMNECHVANEGLNEMLEQLAKDAGILDGLADNVTEDEAPEAPAEPVTKPGDLWILGEHRLLCGDSTKADDVARLMEGKKACCIVTDPPYGVSVAAKNRLLNSVQKAGRCLEDIVDDDLSPSDLQAKLLPVFELIRTVVMSDDCTVFVTAPQGGELCMMMMMMQTAGLKVRHVLIWKKNSPTFSMGRLDYDYQHEPILLTWGKRHKRPMKGQHRTSIWEIDKPRKCDVHPTMKPVELYANAYLNNSDDGDIVFDAYSGSGTGLIASEQVGRKFRGIEISPQYCDVALTRWANLTGKKPRRGSDGFEFIPHEATA